MSWLKMFFSRLITPKETAPVTSKDEIKKISIIVGHGNGDPGAACFNGISENMYNEIVASLILEGMTAKEVRVFKRTSTGIRGVGLRACAWGPDMTIELHLNSYNKKAVGCEVLVLDKDIQSSITAKSFASAFAKKFNRVKRGEGGVKWIKAGDRGYGNLNSVSIAKSSMLVEPFFCDNPEEWIEPVTYAEFLIEWIGELK